MSAYRGWCIRIKIHQCELPHFFPVENTLKDFRTEGWTLFCGAGVVYERQLARDSTPCGVVSTQEKSVFVPGLLELMGYGKYFRNGNGAYPHWVRRNAPPPLAGLYPLRVSLALRAAQPINDKPIFIHSSSHTISCGGCVDPRDKSVIVPGLSGFLKRAWDSILPWWRYPYV